MWHSEWELANQEHLKQRYEEQMKGIFNYASTVRKITCFGCGKEFYTTIKTKKYCSYNTCGNLGNNKLQKYKRYFNRKDMVCPVCEKTFTPKRSDAKYCSNACRQKAYRNSVTVIASTQNENLR